MNSRNRKTGRKSNVIFNKPTRQVSSVSGSVISRKKRKRHSNQTRMMGSANLGVTLTDDKESFIESDCEHHSKRGHVNKSHKKQAREDSLSDADKSPSRNTDLKEIKELTKKLKYKPGKVPKSFYQEGDMAFFHELCDLKFDKAFDMESDGEDGIHDNPVELGVPNGDSEIDSDLADSDVEMASKLAVPKTSGKQKQKGKKFGNRIRPDDDNSDDFNSQEGVTSDLVPNKRVKFAEGVIDDVSHIPRTVDPYGGASEHYVPPHKRFELRESNRSEGYAKAFRECIGLLNRVSEPNVGNICDQVEKLFLKFGTSEANSAISDAVMKLCIVPDALSDRLIFEKVAVIAVVHRNTQSDLGAFFIHNLVWRWENFREQGSLQSDIGTKRSLINCCYCFCYLYIFKVCTNKLIFSIIRRLLERFTMSDIECLLVFLLNAGSSLRKDSIVDMKDIILAVVARGQEGFHSFDETEKTRVGYFLDVVAALKNNNSRKFQSSVDTEGVIHMQHTVKACSKKQLADGGDTINVDYSQIIEVGENGKWWNLGTEGGSMTKTESSLTESGPVHPDDELVALAHQCKMNTPFREALFCVIMTSTDYKEAFEKITNLNLKKNLRDVPFVIMRCCLLEIEYNKFYFHLLKQFGAYDKKFAFTLKFAIADRLKELSSFSKREVATCAKLVSDLILSRSVPLIILETLDTTNLTCPDIIFLRRCIATILCCDVKLLNEVIIATTRLDSGNDFLDGLKVVIKQYILKKPSKLPKDLNFDGVRAGYQSFVRILRESRN